MPWKGERDPYLVWLSEIILQQTRVEQGLSYFERFKAAYPTIADLASAPDDEVMKLWEGLGYYARARNLLATARYVARELNGSFPSTYESIRSLRGVGDYTAAAIASFAFGLPHAVVDGNVQRVLARFFGIETATDTGEGKRELAKLAQELLPLTPKGEPIRGGEREASPSGVRGYNQAIMDFGAGQCAPAAPKCPSCPLRERCTAFLTKKTGELPVKSKKLKRRQRYFNYLVINHLGTTFVKKREGRDIWQHLYEFPLVETDGPQDDHRFLTENETCRSWLGEGWKLLRAVGPLRQELTHQRIVAMFWEVEAGPGFLPACPIGEEANWVATEREKLANFAFPKIVDLYFQQKLLPLELF
jgi:A/G-specific adenine glycosylase